MAGLFFTEEELNKLPNTSWIDVIADDAPIRDHHVGVSGGNENTSYYFGAGLFNQEGIIGKTAFERINLSADIKSKINEKLDFNFFGTYSNNQRNFIFENSENVRLISSIASLPPIYPVYDEVGSPFNNGNRRGVEFNGVSYNAQPEFGNPAIGLRHSDNESVMDVLYGNVLLNWEIVNNFKFSTSYGYLSRRNHIRQFSGRFDYPEQFFTNPTNSLFESFIDENFKQWEGYFTYTLQKVANHNFSFIAGTSVLDNDFSQSSRFGLNFFPNNLDDVNFSNIISDEDKVIPNDVAFRNTTLSFYGIANYNFLEKYLFTASLRADASSKFSEKNRWGIFPAASVGWVISSEDFMANNSIIELLKLRVSWGVNGNDQIAPYQYADRYLREGGSLSKLDFNENVKWEEISQINIGLDANLLANKIGITLDYYVKETSDMLLNFPNPGFLGIPPPVRNAATVRNNGFEAILLYRDKIGSDLSFTLGFNFGTFTNEITDLNGGLPIEAANTRVFNGAPNLTRTDVGHSIASFYGYKFDGLDDKGNPIYADLNNDGTIDPSNDRTYIGNPFPDFTYGLNINLNYKNFDLTGFFYGTQGNDIVNASMGFGVQYSNRTTQVLDAWSHENTSSNIMRPSALEVTNHDFSDYYIEDGSYLRLKNITLGYTLPNVLVDKARIQNFRVYVSANNILTFTGYSGLDPDIGSNVSPLDVGIDRGFYPVAKSITGGFQLSF